MGFNKITPEYLSEYVNFYYGNDTWKYSVEQDISMPKIQAEGCAKVWNLLLDHNIALLSDEVGMGKTIQALGVLVTLWIQKPNAKVLLYAPNENVAKKWINEYNNFIRYHYRITDDIIKSSMNHEPLRNAIYNENHIELIQNVNQIWPSFYICKTSSLSGFLSPKLNQSKLDELSLNIQRYIELEKTEKEEEKWMVKFSQKCNSHFYSKLSIDNEPPFDLLIFDESHYLRRSEGNSNRSIAAHGFFSGRNIKDSNPWDTFNPIAKKTLLLTATPNHSMPIDITNVVSLFNPKYKNKKPYEILNEICVRRFRRLNGKTKHEYRNEIPDPVQFTSLREKLFFAAYHKSLVEYRSKNKENTNNKKQFSILFGYLEGFEFLPRTNDSLTPKNDKKKEKETNGDFVEKEDKELILELSSKFRKCYNEHPNHPKYEKVISNLNPNNYEKNRLVEKKLVFVRRIPSVKEISNRLIEEYDKLFASILQNVIPKKLQRKNNKNKLRRFFWQQSQRDQDSSFEDNMNDPKSNGGKKKKNEDIPNSIFLDLFTKKDEGKYKTTDCFNFKTRFLRNDQLFSIFFEPASDYRSGSYKLNHIFENNGKKVFKHSAQFERLDKLTDKIDSYKIIVDLGIVDTPKVLEKKNDNLDTLLSIWFKTELKSKKLSDLVGNAKNEYDNWTVYEKEGFSTFLQKGILFSSPYIIYLYSFYRDIQNKQDNLRGSELYLSFCNVVEDNIEKTGMAELIAKAILTFKIYYKKELGLTEEKLINEKWSFFNHTIPVYPYRGDTKRRSIIQAFNSPFYPDALIATSVLQEGVDLHYHCAEVIHYGIAWTLGDNEQRVGRVDRMFGKLENSLKVDNNTILPIHFPFLSNTLDQDQMSRFILRKNESEELIDQLKNVDNQSEINFLERVDENAWMSKFRKPKIMDNIKEPYPVNYVKDFNNIKLRETDFANNFLKQSLVVPIIDTLKLYYKNSLISYFDEKDSELVNTFCAIKKVKKDNRHQPILFDIYYFEQGLHLIKTPTYYLRIRTPITKKREYYDDLRKFGHLKELYYDNPLVKICLDLNEKSIMKQYVSADLPLFMINERESNISKDELIYITEFLINFSDSLEKRIHGDDIKNEVIIKEGKQYLSKNKLLAKNRPSASVLKGWKNNGNKNYIYKETYLGKENIIETYKYNHISTFVRKIIQGPDCLKQLGIFKNDATNLELELLDKFYKLTLDSIA